MPKSSSGGGRLTYFDRLVAAENEQPTYSPEVKNQLIINDIIDLNVSAFARKIKEYPRSLNIRGSAGNTPLHIAAYMRNTDFLKLLLATNHCSPNIRNAFGDTVFHICCRLGAFHCLALIHGLSNGEAELLMPNSEGLSALAISMKQVATSDVNMLFSYSKRENQLIDYDREKSIIQEGRLRCADFLRIRIVKDEIERRDNLVEAISAVNIHRERARGIITGFSYVNTRNFLPTSLIRFDQPPEFHEQMDSLVDTIADRQSKKKNLPLFTPRGLAGGVDQVRLPQEIPNPPRALVDEFLGMRPGNDIVWFRVQVRIFSADVVLRVINSSIRTLATAKARRS